MSDLIVIAHRGNISGPDPEKENKQQYLQEALDKGYDVEVDVRATHQEGFWYSGHDGKDSEIEEEFLLKDGVWCHAKDIVTLHRLQEIGAHCFFHERDSATLTSEGYIWTFPLEKLTLISICVMPELQRIQTLDICAGVCTDYADSFKVGK